MQTTQIITLVASVLGAVSATCAWYFKRNPQAVENVIQGAEGVVKAVEPFVIHTPAEPVLSVVDEALSVADTAVRYAEQLYKNDSTVDRKAIATQYVSTIFKELKIEITPQIAAIIDGAIEAAVCALPASQKPSPVVTPVETPKAVSEPVEGGRTA